MFVVILNSTRTLSLLLLARLNTDGARLVVVVCLLLCLLLRCFPLIDCVAVAVAVASTLECHIHVIVMYVYCTSDGRASIRAWGIDQKLTKLPTGLARVITSLSNIQHPS